MVRSANWTEAWAVFNRATHDAAEASLDRISPQAYHAFMADQEAEIIRQLQAEIRRLNSQFQVLKKAILDQYPEGEITKDDLQTLVSLHDV